MNRMDFMEQLERLLQSISPAEREEALQYYNEYFNDAGEENEQDVIEALGNPAKVAENIKKDLYGNGYDESSEQRTWASDRALVEYHRDEYHQDEQDIWAVSMDKYDYSEKKGKGLSEMSVGMIVLLIILGIFASPLIIGIVSAVFGLVIAIITTWFSLIIAFGGIAISFIAVFLLSLVVGIMCMFTDSLVGLAVMGAGMIIGGLGILFLMLTVAITGIVTPAICKGIVGLCRKIFKKKQMA